MTQGLVERQFVGLRSWGVAVFVLGLLGFQGCTEIREWPTVVPSLESTPVPDGDDAADDPFVMLDLSGLTVLGTNKRRGLEVYGGRGELKQRLDRGRLNNVDGYFDVESRRHFIAASNRTAGSVDIFSKAESEPDIRFLRAFSVPLADPYGLCVSAG
jgi:3-phytase